MKKLLVLPCVIVLILLLGVAALAANPPAIEAPQGFDPREGAYDSELVSQHWGSFAAIETEGNYAYVCQGQRLSVFDIANPANIYLAGQSEVMSGDAISLEIAGNYAFLADPGLRNYDIGSRLHVVDISNPNAPFLATYLENLNSKAYDIALYNGYAFLASESLWVVDVRDPLHPVSVTRLAVEHPEQSGFNLILNRIRIAPHPASGRIYAYLLSDEEGDDTSKFLAIVDITDPAHPFKAAHLDVASGLFDLAIGGDRLYVSDEDRLYVIDISNPLAPIQAAASPSGQGYLKLETAGDILFSSHDYTYDLHLQDISNPGLPPEVGVYAYSPGMYLSDMDYHTGQEILYAVSDADLHAIDVSTPSLPAGAGVYTQHGFVGEVFCSEDTLYVDNAVYDISDIEHPVKMGALSPYERAYVDASVGDTIFIVKDEDWLNDPPTPYGLAVANAADPAHIQITDFLTTTYLIRDVWVYGNTAYLAGRDAGLTLVDISDPLDLQVIGQYDPVESVWSVRAAAPANQPGKVYAYLGLQDGVLRILDVSNPQQIMEKGSFNLYTSGRTMVEMFTPTLVVGGPPLAGYYIVMASDTELYTIDVSNPDVLEERGGLSFTEAVRDLETQGDFIYIANGYSGVRRLSYDENGFGPYTRSYYRLPEFIDRISVHDDFVHIASWSSGLFNTWFGPSDYEFVNPAAVETLHSEYHDATLTFPTNTFTETSPLPTARAIFPICLYNQGWWALECITIYPPTAMNCTKPACRSLPTNSRCTMTPPPWAASTRICSPSIIGTGASGSRTPPAWWTRPPTP